MAAHQRAGRPFDAAWIPSARILESIGEGICVVNAEGSILFENPAAVSMLGGPESQVVGRDAHALVHHHLPDGCNYAIEDCPVCQTLRDGVTRRVESAVFFRKDGSYFPVEYVCTALRDEASAIVGGVVCFRDASNRIYADRALRDKATLLSNAQRLGQMGTWSMDLRDGVLLWSDATCELFGILPSQFQNTLEHFHSFVLPADKPSLAAAYAASGGGLLECEYRIRRPDGEVRWMYERGNVEHDAAGLPVRRLGVVMDITERKWGERIQAWETRILEAISSERPLASVLEQVVLGVEDVVADVVASLFVVSPDGTRLLRGAAPSLPEAFESALHGGPVGPELGPCGVAALRGEPSIVTDVEADEGPERHRALAQAHGFRASWSVPVVDAAGNVRAVFGVYCREARAPRASENELLGRMAHVVGIALERDRKEKALRASEERFRRTFRDAATGIAVLDLDGHYQEANAAYCRMLGYDNAELHGRDVLSVTHPEDRDASARLLAELSSGRRDSAVVERRYRTSTGGTVWFRESISVTREPDGRTRSVVDVAEDITQQKSAEARLADQTTLLSNAQRMGRMGTWSMDLRTGELFWSDTTHELFGVPLGAFEGTWDAFYNHVHAEDRPTLDDARERARAGEGVMDFEYRIVRPDGQTCWMYDRSNTEYDKSGVPVRRLGVVMDITSRKRAEREKQDLLLREQAAQREADAASRYYRSLFESAPGCYLVLTPDDFEIVAVSDAYLRATMTTRERIRGRRLFDAFPDDPSDPGADGVQKLRASLEQVKATRRTDVMGVQRYPVRRPEEEGGGFEERYWSSVNCPVPGPDGELAFIIHRVEDVTEYVHMKQRAGVGAEAWRTLESRAAHMEADIVLRSFELKRANDQLAQREALLRIAGEAARLGGWLVTLPELHVTWTDETCRIHDEPPGTRPPPGAAFGYFAPECREAMGEVFEACVKEGTPFDVETRVVTATGRRVWVRAIGEAARAATGEVGHVQGALQDISNRKDVEATLKASEERFRLLARATNDAIRDWSLETDHVWWNEGYEKLFGYRREEIEPSIRSWAEYIHPDDHAAVTTSIRNVIAMGGEDWSSEYRFRCRSGGYAWVLDRGHVIRDAEGKAVRMVCGMTDLTERRSAEEKLREQAELIDKAQDAIIVRDLAGNVLYINQRAQLLYGWTRLEAIGRNVLDMQFAMHPEEFQKANEATLREGEWHGEVHQVRRDGKILLVEARWTLVRDAAGEPRSVLVINTDITERKQLEQQILRTQRMESLGTLAGGIAHDLNNIFAPILMSIVALADGEADEERRLDLACIEACAKRGSALIHQLLSFARGVEVSRVAIDLRHLAQELESVVGDTFPKTIQMRLLAERNLWPVLGDATQVNQVLMNLCVNARDAMPAGGTLVLGLENVVVDEAQAAVHADAKPGNYVVVRVEDTGTGMAPNVLERIFEPFFTTKELGKGTGLGLSTTHAIVKSHGGFIRVQSRVGRGTTFRVYLPADSSASPSAEPPSSRLELPRGHGERVLFVDDEASMRRVMQRTLERFGYRVLLASHGAEAVAVYAQNKDDIDVVITDLAMPVMDGTATIIALRSINPAVKVIVSSGVDGGGKAPTLAGVPPRCFVAKPYGTETILETLRDVLAEPSSDVHRIRAV